MTIQELKASLIKEIDNTADLYILETVHSILFNLKSDIPVLSKWQKKRIKESEKQIERGEFITLEESNKKIEEWLKKIDS